MPVLQKCFGGYYTVIPALWPECLQDNQDVQIFAHDDYFRDLVNENPRRYEELVGIIRNFRWLYFVSKVWTDTKYMGIQILKFPTDMWMMQELLFQVKPDVLIETGTWYGGSALYYAHLMNNIKNGFVVTIDNVDKE